MALVHVPELQSLIQVIELLIREVQSLKERVYPPNIYNNQNVKELLNIKDKVLKKYRDEGMLGYHRLGDKYWYTQDDIDKFLKLIEVPPFLEAV